MSRVLWEEEYPEKPQKKSVFCLICPLNWRIRAYRFGSRGRIEGYEAGSTNRAYESDPVGTLENCRNGLLAGCVLFFMFLVPVVAVAYFAVSNSGYKEMRTGTVVPPLSPRQLVFLKGAVGIALCGPVLYLVSGIRCYLRVLKNPDKPCDLFQKFCLCLAFFLVFLGILLFPQLLFRVFR